MLHHIIKSKSLLTWVGFCLLLTSCQTPDKTPEQGDRGPYINLDSIFTVQLDKLIQTNAVLTKKLTIGEQTEVIVLDTADFKTEMEAFLELDINKPAWDGAFAITSVSEQGETIKTYTALKKEIPIKQVQIIEVNGLIKRIEANVQRGSLISSSQKHLWYEIGKAYGMELSQNMIGLDSKDFKVEVTIE